MEFQNDWISPGYTVRPIKEYELNLNKASFWKVPSNIKLQDGYHVN